MFVLNNGIEDLGKFDLRCDEGIFYVTFLLANPPRSTTKGHNV